MYEWTLKEIDMSESVSRLAQTSICTSYLRYMLGGTSVAGTTLVVNGKQSLVLYAKERFFGGSTLLFEF